MIIHVSGRLGSGKTLWAVSRIVDIWIRNPEVVVYTNIRFRDFWDYSLASWYSRGVKSFLRFVFSPFGRRIDYIRYLACSFSSRYVYVPDFSVMMEKMLSLGPAPEGSRLVVWDEVHLDLHAREWKKTSMDYVRFFSMSRKLGFDIIMVTQITSSLDRQVRELADFSYVLKKIPFLSSVFRFGLLVKRWSNISVDNSDKSLFVGAGVVRYNSFYNKIYDTTQNLAFRNYPPPSLWYMSSPNGCHGCAYMNFYHQYCDYIRDMRPILSRRRVPIGKRAWFLNDGLPL